MGDEFSSLNELIDSLRAGELEGTIELTVRTNGRENKVFIRTKSNRKNTTTNVAIQSPIKGISFAGFDLSGSDLSGTEIIASNFRGSDLNGVSFSKSKVSESDFSFAYNVNPQGAYLTGSVNLNYTGTSYPSLNAPLGVHSKQDPVTYTPKKDDDYGDPVAWIMKQQR